MYTPQKVIEMNTTTSYDTLAAQIAEYNAALQLARESLDKALKLRIALANQSDIAGNNSIPALEEALELAIYANKLLRRTHDDNNA
jgi:hypothetical protein